MKRTIIAIIALMFILCSCSDEPLEKEEKDSGSSYPINRVGDDNNSEDNLGADKLEIEDVTQEESSYDLMNNVGNVIDERVLIPPGYQRIDLGEGSFQQYLRKLPLKPSGTKVTYYNGKIKPNTSAYCAVVDIDVGDRNLQQCADAVMRLRAEYLYGVERYDDIHFNFTSGFRADYSKWMAGNRVKIDGNNAYWEKVTSPDNSYKSFRKYMDIIFAYAGTLSLSKELIPINVGEMNIGDVFIQGGSPGHTVIIVDMAVHEESGERLFLLAQSYMPAQDIHILNNPMNDRLSPWYKIDTSKPLKTPEWTFDWPDLMRFEE